MATLVVNIRNRILYIIIVFSITFLLFTSRPILSYPRTWKSPIENEYNISNTLYLEPQFSRNPTSIQEPLSKPTKPHLDNLISDTSSDQACYGFPNTEDILLIMKTGATEAYEKLPIHFLTTLKCVNDSLLVSDMEMTMGSYHLIDVLGDFPTELQKDNSDFDLYQKLNDFKKLHQDPRSLKTDQNSWNLDKYKFIPMLQRAWKYRQTAKWYVFMEADSSINWDNLRLYLDMLNSTQKYYIGSATYLDIGFAHGGTGYVISQAAMKVAIGDHPEIGEKYNLEVRDHCCGDRFVARIMLDQGIELTKAWPMFNGEKPSTVPFGQDTWCQPVISMHHLTSEEVSQVWNFGYHRRKMGMKPLLWKDIFNYFVLEALTPQRENWDNLARDNVYTTSHSRLHDGREWTSLSVDEQTAGESPSKCKALCDHDSACLQWMHRKNECYIGYHIKLGNVKVPEEEVGQMEKTQYISGWKYSKIGEFRQKLQECANGPEWNVSENN